MPVSRWISGNVWGVFVLYNSMPVLGDSSAVAVVLTMIIILRVQFLYRWLQKAFLLEVSNYSDYTTPITLLLLNEGV